jgi:hypothetical protein
MTGAPTPTVATATAAAAAVPTAGCTRRRLRVERTALTVVIVFLHMLFSASVCISRLLSSGVAVVGASTKTACGEPDFPHCG